MKHRVSSVLGTRISFSRLGRSPFNHTCTGWRRFLWTWRLPGPTLTNHICGSVCCSLRRTSYSSGMGMSKYRTEHSVSHGMYVRARTLKHSPDCHTGLLSEVHGLLETQSSSLAMMRETELVSQRLTVELLRGSDVGPSSRGLLGECWVTGVWLWREIGILDSSSLLSYCHEVSNFLSHMLLLPSYQRSKATGPNICGLRHLEQGAKTHLS